MEEVKKEVELTPEVKEVLPVDEATLSASSIETHTIETESFDDEFESGEGLLTGAKYDVPDSADKFVDTKDGTVVDKKNLTPFQMIKAIAKQNNHVIKDPNPSCHKCYGRGYEGFDAETKMPIPCRCLFRGKTDREKTNDLMYDNKNNPGKPTRLQRRRIAKALFKQFKIQRKLIKQGVKEEKEAEHLTEGQENEFINKVLKKYIKLQSIKKTAKEFNLTLTSVKKLIDENREKLNKMKTEKE